MTVAEKGSKPKKLSRLNVKRVALVDVPAVAGSTYLIAKSASTDSTTDTAPMEETEETAMSTEAGKTEKDTTQTTVENTQKTEQPQTVQTEKAAEKMSPDQQRAVFYAINMIEGANFFDSEGNEPEPMPDSVMNAVKALRNALGDRVAKRLEVQEKKSVAKADTALQEKVNPFLVNLKAVDTKPLEKKGAIVTQKARGQARILLTEVGKGLVAVTEILGDKPALAVNLLKECKESLALMATATDLTAEESDEAELAELNAKQEKILSRQLKAQLEAMTSEEFEAHLAQCTDEERESIISFLDEIEPEPETTVAEDDETEGETGEADTETSETSEVTEQQQEAA